MTLAVKKVQKAMAGKDGPTILARIASGAFNEIRVRIDFTKDIQSKILGKGPTPKYLPRVQGKVCHMSFDVDLKWTNSQCKTNVKLRNYR